MDDHKESMAIDLPHIKGLQLTQEEIDKLEIQEMLDSISSSFENIEFSEDEMDDEFLLTRASVKEEKTYIKEDRSASKSSMENFASDVVTAEDFEEGPERMAFEAVFSHSRNCFNIKTSEKKRIKSLQWVFIPNTGVVPYDLCCQAVGIRANLLRIRIQYELFQNWIVLTQPIHFMMEPLPSTFEAEVLYNHTESHLKVAKKIWTHPSITTDKIHAFCHEHKIEGVSKILDALEAEGSVASKMDHWYFTGRNPQKMGLRRRDGFSWASLSGL